MDGYTKAILTVIAVALTAIAAHAWSPKEAIAAPFGMAPTTVGDFIDAGKIKDPKAREEATFRRAGGCSLPRAGRSVRNPVALRIRP